VEVEDAGKKKKEKKEEKKRRVSKRLGRIK
jgi:hypothetical protein